MQNNRKTKLSGSAEQDGKSVSESGSAGTHRLWNEREVAQFYGVSVATIRRWRLFRRGPKFLKIGASVRYKPADVCSWLASRPTGGEHDPVEAL
jgi:predicted DNA-binding transcriptional regulator AlpA